MRRVLSLWPVQFVILAATLGVALWAWAEFTLTPSLAPVAAIVIAQR